MRAQEEVKLSGMCDTNINGGSSRNVSTFPTHIAFVSAEKSGVMTFLHNEECDSRPILGLQLDACFANGRQLMLQHTVELSLGHAISVVDDAIWLEAS